MSIRFRNYSMFTEKKYDRNWYEWCVFVDSDREVVDRINAVEYKLHPTFPDPVRLITQKENRFALFSSGWGGFLIKTRVIFEDGAKRLADITWISTRILGRRKPRHCVSAAQLSNQFIQC